jgi:hypothetical protein
VFFGGFILSGYPHVEEGVMPILQRSGLWNPPDAPQARQEARTPAVATLEGRG